MKSKTSKRFRELLRDLPPDVRRQALAAYRQFKRDPYHPSLHFKRVSQTDPIYSARVGDGYRALGVRRPSDTILWYWIGSHADYDKLLGK